MVARRACSRGRSGRARAAGPDGTTSEVVPAGFNVRTAVHEYGGGAYCIHRGTAFVSNFDDQRLYRVDRPRGARADHARRRRSAPSLRGRARHGRRLALDRRSRAALRQRQLQGRPERARRPADRRLRGAASHRRGSRLLLHAADRTRRDTAVLSRVGSAVDAVGRLRAPRRRPRARRDGRERSARGRRRRRRVDLAA